MLILPCLTQHHNAKKNPIHTSIKSNKYESFVSVYLESFILCTVLFSNTLTHTMLTCCELARIFPVFFIWLKHFTLIVIVLDSNKLDFSFQNRLRFAFKHRNIQMELIVFRVSFSFSHSHTLTQLYNWN